MDETGSNPDLGSYPIPPASVHFASSSSRVKPLSCSSPLKSSQRLNFLSLQGLGLLVNSDVASSARSIGVRLSRDETLAWELFTPYQRLLIVALIGVAAAESKKNGVIRQLQKSVDFRDQVLSRMQQKLDDLCQQLNLMKFQSGTESKVSNHDDPQSTLTEKFGSERMHFVDCGCWLCDEHLHQSSPAIQDKASISMVIDAEPEERRMSYMSDWCSSVTSAAEIHFDNLSLDQDMISLRKECQEKDATIKDLTSFLQATTKAGSKRETELEEIIRRKKTIIKKLKRDVLMLEEKVTQLTRPRRSSYSPSVSNPHEFPMRMDNLLYDLDILTTSSSDSEATANTTQRPVPQSPVDSIKKEPSVLEQTHKSAPAKSSASLVKPVKPPSVVTPSTNPKPRPVSSSSSSSSRMRRPSSSTSDSKKPRRPIQNIPRDASVSHKRWV